MIPPEILSLVGQGAIAGIFAWLYIDLKKRNQEQDDKHKLEIARLYDLRILEIKMLGNLPTDLEGDYKMGPDSRIKA